MWASIVAAISSPVSQWVKNRGEIKKAKHQRDLAVIENQARLAADKQEFNHQWEMASLQDKDKGLRWISFTLFTAPIVIVVVAPEEGQQIFQNLETVPDWMMTIWFTMISGVWGVSALKDAVPQLISGFKNRKK